MSELPCVVVLAAGQGSRYRQVAGAGEDKLLALCRGRDGVVRPVIEQVLKNLPASLVRRVLVTTADRLGLIALAETYGCQVVLVDSPGMGDSLAAAVGACVEANGWLVVLGDMPFILPSSIERVAQGLGKQMIRVPVHDGTYGHPVAFGASFGPALLALSGDRGARPLFALGQVVEVTLVDAGVLWDVDVPQALLFRD
ncbi:nucleotidyltransferase family protein [Pseudomonas chlororaphis]|uniref:Molybdopterin-guanine dinucleotide biosynthesis protein MobA n=1 Tax=Pseudomonas chlororaphis TaxID=587753 RepID=A0A1Q8ETA5_9PSED|nr:nucleotidyltransferase family protein [Pseudomonas chlororaphis]OLF55020.1 molybdopterin-guanine dinucleotide biosynthesis protein MobA [Pseudomonas chlororaphis]